MSRHICILCGRTWLAEWGAVLGTCKEESVWWEPVRPIPQLGGAVDFTVKFLEKVRG